jgi:hypothetical protein
MPNLTTLVLNPLYQDDRGSRQEHISLFVLLNYPFQSRLNQIGDGSGDDGRPEMVRTEPLLTVQQFTFVCAADSYPRSCFNLD